MSKGEDIAGAIGTLAVFAVIVICVSAFFGFSIFTVVGAGESGVKFNYFSGGVQDDEFGE